MESLRSLNASCWYCYQDHSFTFFINYVLKSPVTYVHVKHLMWKINIQTTMCALQVQKFLPVVRWFCRLFHATKWGCAKRGMCFLYCVRNLIFLFSFSRVIKSRTDKAINTSGSLAQYEKLDSHYSFIRYGLIIIPKDLISIPLLLNSK